MSLRTYQERVRQWINACFPESIATNRGERAHRFLEEALELVQVQGCTREEAHSLVDYVYSRPKGEPFLEAGGTLLTLAALCNVDQIDLESAGNLELDRNWQRMERIREKRSRKPEGSALPQ